MTGENDPIVQRVIRDSLESVIEVVRENRFLWLFATLITLANAIATDNWFRWVFALLAAYCAWRVVTAWRLLHEARLILAGRADR